MSRIAMKGPVTRKVAMFNIGAEYPCDLVMVATDGEDSRYPRLSEVVEVTFTPLPREDVVAQSVRAIDKEREAVVEEFTKKLRALDDAKARILALPAPTTSEPAAEAPAA